MNLDALARPGSKLRRVLDLLADGKRHYSHELHGAYRGDAAHGWEFRGAVDQLRKKGLVIPDATWDEQAQDHWYQWVSLTLHEEAVAGESASANSEVGEKAKSGLHVPERSSRKPARVPASSAQMNRNQEAALGPLFR